jgi:HPt (histidine-containing phosphotransfer) domain-containing protein
MRGDREKCLAVGMDDYISKPVTLEELEAVLERWMPMQVRESELKTTPLSVPETPTFSNPASVDTTLCHSTNDVTPHKQALPMLFSEPKNYMKALTPNGYVSSGSTYLKATSFAPGYLDEEPVNLERLNELARGDTEFKREILQVFTEDALTFMEELKLALSAGDCVTIARRAHQLKGSSATLSIRMMPELAARLESQAKNNQLLDAAELVTELEKILERIQVFMANDEYSGT